MANTTKLNIEVGMHANRQEFDKLNRDLESLLLKIKQQTNAQTDPKIKKELEEQFKTIEKMAMAYEKAFDNRTGQVNIQKLNQEMQKANITVQQFYNSMAKAGQDGAVYYNNWANSILNANIQLKQSNQLLDRMAVTFKNTIRYGISSSIFNNFTNSIQKAYNYTKNLDTSLNDIRIVSNQSADQMERLAVSANKAAKALGKTTLDYTKAATIYYQQGLSSDEVEKRTEATLKAANVTGQNAQEVSEQLTAVWNGYRVTGRELELYVDKLAAVAANSASNLEELSTGMSKVASAANIMGVDIDQLTAQMSTIISVTRQAPESVGTALRTVYGRIADIKAGLDEDTSLGNYSGKMAKLGYNVLDASGNLRDMGDVIEEIGNSWNNLTREQQINLAQTMAGIRQYNNLLTLFDNWDKYTDALTTAENAAGTLQHQQDIYMESTQAHLEQLQATAEETYSALFDQEQARDFIDLVTNGLSTINKYLNGLNSGALGGVLGQLGALGANLFSNQIASGISTNLANQRIEQDTQQKLALKNSVLKTGSLVNDVPELQKVTDKSFERASRLDNIKNVVSPEQYKQLTEDLKVINEYEQKNAGALAEYEKTQQKVVELEKQFSEEVKRQNELLEKRQKNGGKLSKEEEQELADLKSKMSELNNAYGVLDSQGKVGEGNETAKEVAEKEAAYEATVRQAEEQQRINTIIRGTTALLATWNNAMAGIDIITDDELSNWEKFQGLIGVAISQGMLLLTSYNSLQKLLPTLVVQYKLVNVEKGKELTIDTAEQVVREKGVLWTLKEIAAKVGEKIATIASTVAKWGEVAVQTILNILTLNFGSLTVAATAATVAFTAALIAGTVAIIDANTGLNYYNKQIDAAAENTKKAKEEFNELKETFDAYKEAKKNMDELTVGTLEYYDAMVKANEEAQKLIDTLGLIAGTDYTISEGGLIQISDQKLQDLQFKEQQKVFQASAIEYQKRFDKAEYQRLEAGAKLHEAVKNQYQEEQKKIEKDKITQESQKLIGEKLPLADFEKENIELDITDWQIAEKAVYSQAEEEAIQLKRMLADQIIRGYASQADIEIYSNMNSAGKKIIQDAVADAAQKNKNNAAFEQELVSTYEKIPFVGDFFGGLGQWWADVLPNNGWGKAGSVVLPWLLPGVGGSLATYDKFQEREIKEDYMKNILGMSEDEITKEARDKINVNTALEALRGGTQAGIETQKSLTEVYNEALTKGSNANVNKTAQEYYANVMMAFAQKDIEAARESWSKLTTEERAKLAGQDEVIADRIEYGDLSATQTANEAVARGVEDNDLYNETLKEQAQALDTTTTALKLYGAAMRNAGQLEKENNAETADAIANSYKFNKAYNDAVKVYKNNTDAIKDWTKAWKNHDMVSYETADAMAELTDEVSKMMGYDVSPDFMIDNLDLIKTMLTGTAEEAQKAYKKLQVNSIGDILKSQFGDDAVNAVFTTKNALTEFSEAIANMKVNEDLTGPFKENLIQMVNASNMTKEQIEELFSKMHLKVPKLSVTTKTVSLPEEKRHHNYSGTMVIPDGSGGYTYENVDYGWIETVSPLNQSFVSIDDNVDIKSTGGGATTKGNFAKAPSNTSGSKKKGSSSKPSKKDPNKDELDRYQLVNVQLKEVSKQLTKLDKQKNKLLGGDLIKNLNQQIKLLNDQMDVTQAKLKIAKQEQKETASALSKYGIKFDDEGNISNYATVFKQQQAKLNAVYAKYNKMSKTAQEAYQSTVKAAEESWKKFKDGISKYDNLIGEMIPQLYQDLQDAYDKQTEMFIEEMNMEIKLRLDVSQAKRDWNEFKRKVIDEIDDKDILGLSTSRLKDFFSYYNEEGNAEVQALTKRIQQQLEELRKQDAEGENADWYRDNRAKSLEDLIEYYDKIRDSLEQVLDLQKELQQNVLDMMDQAQDKFDEQIDTFEIINKQLEHNVEIINLLNGDNNYQQLTTQYNAQTKNRKEELDFYTKQKAYWENYFQTLEKGTKEWEKAKEKYNEAAEAWSNALTSTIQAARTEFENNINLIFQILNNQLTNGKGLDYINEEWSLLGENTNLVLDNINKMQGLQDLGKKYNDAINSTSNIKAQQKLAELRDSELEALKEMDSLSQDDLTRAEKKLEIVKAQIALEDAQRNKSQMRLRRDSQGNYRYQFVADDNQIQQAQANLYAAYNELYNFDKSRYTNTLNEAYDVWQEYQKKMADAILIKDPEEQAAELLLLQTQYGQKYSILQEQLQRTMQDLNHSTFADLNALYAENENNYSLMTQEQREALNDFGAANQTAFDLVFDLYTENTEKFRNMAQDQIDVIENQMIPQWTSGYQALIDQIASEGGFEEVSNRLLDELEREANELKTSLEEIETVAGNTFENVISSQNDIIDNNIELLNDNSELIDSYKELTDGVVDLYQDLIDLMNAYEQAAKDAKDAAEDAYNYIVKSKTGQGDAAQENIENGPVEGGTGAYNSTPTTTATTSTTSNAKKTPSIPFDGTLPKGTQLYSASGSKYNQTQAARTVTVTADAGKRYQVWGSTFNPHTVYIDKNAIKYDTGGYTGEWGNGGRLAMLHQKELVLNKKDTANMLNAVEVLRGITDSIGADLLGRMAGMTAGGFNSTVGGNALEQSVHIEATFPGVKSSIEIQDALNNLVNMAAQRAQIR